jgi:uncharacterized membrane protein (UPF0182 family)
MLLVVVIVLAIVVIILAPAAAGLYTEFLWFQSVGQLAVFTTSLTGQVTLFAIGAGTFLALAMLNLLIARSVARRLSDVQMSREGVLTYIARIQARSTDRLITFGALGLALVVSLFLGLAASAQWLLFARFIRQTSFGIADPLFGLDVSYFVFSLPLYRFVQGWLIAAIVLVTGLTGMYYAFRTYGLNVQAADLASLAKSRGVRVHLSSLVAAIALLLAIGYRFDSFDLDYAYRGVVHGAGYADRFAELPALTILGGIAVLTAVALVVNAFRRGFAFAGLAIAVWIFAAIVVGGIYPALVQQLQVKPSELAAEKPFLASNIQMTRRAFNLDSIDSQLFPGDPEPKAGVVERNPGTFSSLRLWDHRPLLSTYNQIQTIRLYYDFNDIDVDRYYIDNQYRQVMLSARELAPSKLPGQAQTWLVQHLQFTHGYGAAMSPVNEVTPEGLPQLLVKDIPPTGSIPITRPEIYYGETNDSYVVVDTSADEFDYAQGNQNITTRYAGNSGVLLDSGLKKTAFALSLGDPNLLLTSYIQPSSRILYHRSITDRLNRVAPFLEQDSDPYLVVSNGQLYWIQDAYTVSDAFPYSTPYQNGFNYIRNSVKAVTNAYDGSIHLYVSDPSDPIIQTYEKIFPSLFEPMSAMPADLRQHVRYPEGIFLVQADMLRAYHMQDPEVFYNREDLWDLPQEVGPDGNQEMQPYYVIMRLPGQDQEEFLLMLPFTPSGKTNMVAWLAAESDGANYGKMVVFDYPKDTVVFGPQQVEARIDQDTQISQLLSLWNQQGSRVIRGNLLVLPIENSTLYFEPLYLQANQSQIPELKRVILATQNRLVMGTSLADGLSLLFGPGQTTTSTGGTVVSPAAETAPTATPTPSAAPAGGSVPAGDVAALAQSAESHYEQAQAALKNGDWTTYGQQLQAMDDDLKRLVTATH